MWVTNVHVEVIHGICPKWEQGVGWLEPGGLLCWPCIICSVDTLNPILFPLQSLLHSFCSWHIKKVSVMMSNPFPICLIHISDLSIYLLIFLLQVIFISFSINIFISTYPMINAILPHWFDQPRHPHGMGIHILLILPADAVQSICLSPPCSPTALDSLVPSNVVVVSLMPEIPADQCHL